MDTKALAGVRIKNADKGEVEAVFASYNVEDKDGDVTLPGAFVDGAPVRISAYQHKTWDGLLPVGRGVIRVNGDDAVLDGRFFLNTTAGRDTFEVVKEMGDLQEWSYGYDALDTYRGEHKGRNVRFLPRQVVHEVSPVMIGAGNTTRTLAVKSGLRYADEASAVVAAVSALVDRTADVLAKRSEKGKGLGEDSLALLAEVETQIKRLGDLLVSADPSDGDDLTREYLRFLSITSAAKELV
jgi:HK97 family phage prohead protease